MAYLTVDDLDPFADIETEKAQAMIDDATATAISIAPCIADEGDLTPDQVAVVKAVLRAAVLRWNEAGAGALVAKTTGPFSETLDTRQRRNAIFWDSEIERLEAICSEVAGGSAGRAFSINTAGGLASGHADICSLVFGANYCSCGADLTLDGPLWETGRTDVR